MRTVGIIAEFNPFHNGHKHIIDKVKAQGDRVVCVIGDDFTQRGDVAIISKYARAEMALHCGADLCVLLPAPWSMSCAYNFALGGVSVLHSLGNIDAIAFGSECGDISKIKLVVDALQSEKLPDLLHSNLKHGTTFAKARELAVNELIGENSRLLSSPNDTLATEYIMAANNLSFNGDFLAIKRVGSMHDTQESIDGFLSASAIREHIKSGNTDSLKEFMPTACYNIIKREIECGKIADIKNIELAILSHLRRLTAEDIINTPEVSEGLENKIISAAQNSTSLQEFYESIKSKRYTLARIRRIILSAFLGFDMSFFGKSVPYIKILGFNDIGEQIIKEAKPAVPLITRSRDFLQLENDAKLCFNLQNTAANLYPLSFKKCGSGNSEYTNKIIKI